MVMVIITTNYVVVYLSKISIIIAELLNAMQSSDTSSFFWLDNWIINREIEKLEGDDIPTFSYYFLLAGDQRSALSASITNHRQTRSKTLC